MQVERMLVGFLAGDVVDDNNWGGVMSTRSIVIAELANVAEEQGREVGPLTDQTMLLETGLDSLCLAVLVVRLQDRLGVDPFSTPDGVGFPVTLGDFVEMYERATP